MSLTILGSGSDTLPILVCTPFIETKKEWSDTWMWDPSLVFESARECASGQDLGTMSFRREYGRVKDIEEGQITTRQTINLTGWWVRMTIVSNAAGREEVWFGKISGATRQVYASREVDDERINSGVQTWTAYSPLQLLRKTDVSRSHWWDHSNEQDLGWLPDMNRSDSQGMLVGNRSADPHANAGGVETYLYGGTNLWNRKQYIQYLLARFANGYDDQGEQVGPRWVLGGQTELLENMTGTVSWQKVHSIAGMLRELINPRIGLDFKVVPAFSPGDEGQGQDPDELYMDGFEVHVFALTSEDWNFGGHRIPRNPATVELSVTETAEAEPPTIEQSDAQKYDTLRVFGERAVVCCTLQGSGVGGATTLTPKWDTSGDLLADYKAGAGGDDAAANDKVRQDDRFRPVYQMFGAPTDWDFNGGLASPALDGAGQFVDGEESDESPIGEYQTSVRETLPWLPLLEGYDYMTGTPISNNPAGFAPDYLPPVAWIYDEAEESARWLPLDSPDIGVAVHANRLNWGVFLSATPNHLLAKNHFSGANETNTQPAYDFDKLVVTLAIKTDQRLELVAEIGETGDGSCKDIPVAGAEFWYLAPGTVLGVHEGGTLQYFRKDGEIGLVLRNDAERLYAAMAGALARYVDGRNRATISLKGLWPYQGLLGQILTVIDEGGETRQVRAPITSIKWQGGPEAKTVIKTGFAK